LTLEFEAIPALIAKQPASSIARASSSRRFRGPALDLEVAEHGMRAQANMRGRRNPRIHHRAQDMSLGFAALGLYRIAQRFLYEAGAEASMLDMAFLGFCSARQMHVPLIYVSYITDYCSGSSRSPEDSDVAGRIIPVTLFIILMLFTSLHALATRDISETFPPAGHCRGTRPLIPWASMTMTAGADAAGIPAWMTILWSA